VSHLMSFRRFDFRDEFFGLRQVSLGREDEM
jgi:hypothetical protein